MVPAAQGKPAFEKAYPEAAFAALDHNNYLDWICN
jgi:hypothetical protein